MWPTFVFGRVFLAGPLAISLRLFMHITANILFLGGVCRLVVANGMHYVGVAEKEPPLLVLLVLGSSSVRSCLSAS
jgi:hypothetical protein